VKIKVKAPSALAETCNLMSNHIADHTANGFVVLRSKIRRLPGVHRASLKALVEHLSRVASRADKNKMDAKNLAIVFSPVVFGEDEIPQGDLLSVQPAKVRSACHLFSSTYRSRIL
jgi:hypothetical protein